MNMCCSSRVQNTVTIYDHCNIEVDQLTLDERITFKLNHCSILLIHKMY